MADRRALLIAVVFALLSSGMSLGFGCGDEPPVQIEFQDASEGCNPTPDRLTHHIARSARLDLTVLADGVHGNLAAAWVDDEAVLSVESSGTALENPVGLRAVDVGTTTVYVRLRSGDESSLELSVAEPSSAVVTPDPLTVWNLDTDLNVRFAEATTDLTAAGFALLPDGILALRVELRGEDGRELIGYGAADWTASPPLVTFESVDPLSDNVRVWPGDDAGDVVISTAAGGRFEVSLVGEQGADTVAVYFPELGMVGDALSLAVGETRTIVLIAFDEADRLLIGNGPDGFEAEVIDFPDVARVVSPPWGDEGGGDVEIDEALVAFLLNARVTYVEGLEPGQATLSLSAADRSAEVAITVAE